MISLQEFTKRKGVPSTSPKARREDELHLHQIVVQEFGAREGPP